MAGWGTGVAGVDSGSELETVNMAYKATHVSNVAQDGVLSLNSDGTTLGQIKHGTTVISGTLVSVNELPDGCAESIIEDMDCELRKLRDAAHMLKLCNADSINWTLVSSSTSDSASTQRKLNALIEERKKRDETSTLCQH